MSREPGQDEPPAGRGGRHRPCAGTADPGGPRERIFYELYRDRAAFSDHQAQPHTRRVLTEREPQLEWTLGRSFSGVTHRGPASAWLGSACCGCCLLLHDDARGDAVTAAGRSLSPDSPPAPGTRPRVVTRMQLLDDSG